MNATASASGNKVFISTTIDHDGTPRIIWRTRVDGIFQESIPAIHGDRAFILCSDGFLYSFQ
jgi:hypothetical protein